MVLPTSAGLVRTTTQTYAGGLLRRTRQCRHVLPPARRAVTATAAGKAAAEKQAKPITDIVAYARNKARNPNPPPVVEQPVAPPSPVSEFLSKVHRAWRIFFPAKERELTPREAGRQRLRMILVADRCGLNPTMLTEMKSSIVEVVQEYVDIEAEELVDVSVSMDPDLGTIYSVSLPVKRVKPQAAEMWSQSGPVDGISVEWEDWDKDPSARFPYGC